MYGPHVFPRACTHVCRFPWKPQHWQASGVSLNPELSGWLTYLVSLLWGPHLCFPQGVIYRYQLCLIWFLCRFWGSGSQSSLMCGKCFIHFPSPGMCSLNWQPEWPLGTIFFCEVHVCWSCCGLRVLQMPTCHVIPWRWETSLPSLTWGTRDIFLCSLSPEPHWLAPMICLFLFLCYVDTL